MKRIYFACLFLLLNTTFLFSQSNPVSLANQTDPKTQAKILDSYGKAPLAFEANHGQTDARVKFLSRTSGYSLFLTGDEAVLALSGKKANAHKAKITGVTHTLPSDMASAKAGGVLRMKLRNANLAAKISGMDELAGTSNYFIGNDPKKWRSNVPTYAKVKYEGIYSGIDLIYYGNQRQLEYDFVVAPGGNPRRIQFDVRGAKRIRDAQGELVFKVGDEEIRWHKPRVYQEKNGTRQEIAARYAITDRNRVAFELAKYDASRPLYIDPLIYSTYLGGSNTDLGNAIAVDTAGNAYVTGYTPSTDFPTMNPLQPANGGSYDAFVSELNSTGSALVYSTYLGGSGDDRGNGIAVDAAGNAYITGTTYSNDFPMMNPLQPAFDGRSDAFVTKIGPAGSALVYSTYLGGAADNFGYGIAVDSAGNAYVTGATSSLNFPVTPGAFQTAPQGGGAFVTKINAAGSALVYSTYLGGSDQGNGIAVDGAGNAYVTGQTQSTNFPVTPGAFQTTCGNPNPGYCQNAFVAEVNPTGSALIYSTYLGGSKNDSGKAIAVDGAGNAYVTGTTPSTDFPTMNPLQPANGGEFDAFVTKINPSGSALIYSTYLGGSGVEDSFGGGIAVDGAGNAYVTGDTNSGNFPTMSPLQPINGGNFNAFVTKINSTGSAIVYSTYLGGSEFDHGTGIAVDSEGNAYVTGYADSTDFPTMNPLQPYSAYGDAFVAKISPDPYDVMLFPLHLDYGNQVMGVASSPQVSTLTNASNTAVTIASMSVGGVDNGDFALTNNCGTTVPVGGSCSITVTFTPTAKGHRSAAVSITDSAPDSPQSFSLTGVGFLDTATKLTSSKNPSGQGTPVTFKATVSSPSGGTPTGVVYFADGGVLLARKVLSGNTATFATSKLSLGLHLVTALYSGDWNYGSSTSAPVNQSVLEATTTTLSSSPNPSAYGQAVVFTATVTSSIGALPDGETVTFTQGATVLGTGTLSGGSTSFTTSTLKAGTTSVTAVYGGDSNFAGSTSKVVSQVVVKYPTTTTVSSSLNPSNYGQAVTLAATVTSAGPTPTGTVTFKNGSTSLGGATLVAGVAKITKSTLPAGTLAITVTYNGDTANNKSTSPALSQVVTQATTTTTVTSSPNPSVVGQNVTFKATVKSPTVIPVGTVTFTAGTTTLGTVSLAGGKASLTTSALPGKTTVTATYNGTSNITGSSGSVVQTVD